MPKTATPRKPETLERRLAETRNTSRNRNLAGLLGLQDRNPLRDMLSAANDVTGRGMIAGFLGLPGDLGGMAENGIRYALGMPQVQPYGGSEHIGQQMEKAGLVTAKRRPVAETLASLISPSAAATAVFKAPAAARAGVRLLDNLADSRGMGRGLANSQVGAIETNLGKMVAPDEYDVIRYDADGDIPTFDKPHGIYTTPKGVESPHTGVGGNVSKWKLNPSANVLNIEVVDGKSLAMRRDAVGAGAGVAVVRELLGTPVFNEIKGLSKPQLIDWIAQNTKLDRSMFEGYYDSQEVMEGLGGMLARDRGYDAISYKDRTPFWGSPEFDEVVLLSDKSIIGRNGQQARK